MTNFGVGIYDNFPGYRVPSKEELDNALRSALIIVDANVLLNLYRYNASARNDLINVLRHAGDRLWVPHQALREFWRNRTEALTSRGARVSETVEALAKQRRATIDIIQRWAKVTAIETDEVAPLISTITSFYSDLEDKIQARDPARETLSNIASEPVLDQLEELLQGRVGTALGQAEWEAAVKIGNDRVKQRQPPGYLDSDKLESALPEGAAGDYLVWDETMSEAERRNLDVVLVTGDEKEDWWRRYRTEFLGPRPELVDELKARCGRQLYMMRPIDVLRHASALDVVVRRESVDDVERVTRESVPGMVYGRDETTWDELVDLGLEYLIDVAKVGDVVSYNEFNDALKSLVSSSFDLRRQDERAALNHLLTLIVDNSYPETNLIISALVIDKSSNEPGPGFYRLAQDFGLLKRGADAKMKSEFWLNHVDSLREYYLASSP